jgi:hypothetical protein
MSVQEKTSKKERRAAARESATTAVGSITLIDDKQRIQPVAAPSSLDDAVRNGQFHLYQVKLGGVSAPLVPSPLDYVGPRPFAIYPAVKNNDPNEWRLAGGSWSEVRVINVRNGTELWIPRQYIGAVSEPEDSPMVVGLTTELQLRNGSVEPKVKRVKGVIEMPHPGLAMDDIGVESFRRPNGPAPVVDIRIRERYDSSLNRAMASLAIGAMLVCLLAALLAAASGSTPQCADTSAACSGQ